MKNAAEALKDFDRLTDHDGEPTTFVCRDCGAGFHVWHPDGGWRTTTDVPLCAECRRRGETP